MTVKHRFEQVSPTEVIVFSQEPNRAIAKLSLLLPHKLDIDPLTKPKSFGKIEVFTTSSGGVRLTLLE